MKEYINTIEDKDELKRIKNIWDDGIKRFNVLMQDKLENLGWRGTMNEAGGQKKYERINAWDRKKPKNVSPIPNQPKMMFAGGKNINFEDTLALSIKKLTSMKKRSPSNYQSSVGSVATQLVK